MRQQLGGIPIIKILDEFLTSNSIKEFMEFLMVPVTLYYEYAKKMKVLIIF